MTPKTFGDLTEVLDELAAAFDDVDLGALHDDELPAVQAAWLAATRVCRAADDLAVRVRAVVTDTILRSPATRR